MTFGIFNRTGITSNYYYNSSNFNLLIYPILILTKFNYTYLNMNITKIVQTTKGVLPSPFSTQQSCPCILFHQVLFNTPTLKQAKVPLNLQNIKYHIHSPNNQQNTTLSSSLIQHQIAKLIIQNDFKMQQFLILDGSDYRKKISEIFQKYFVIKGFNYRISQGVHFKQQQRKALLKKQHVYKQIQFEFKIGNEKYKPGFIGQIYLNEFKSQDKVEIYQAYIQYSSKTQCPILMNFLQVGEQCLFSYWKQSQVPISLSQKISLLKYLLQLNQTKNSRLVILNIPIVFVSRSNILRTQFIQLLDKYKIYIGFDMLRYVFDENKLALQQICWFVNNYPDRIILSSGIRYKTDTKAFGGEGLSLYNYIGKFQDQPTNLFHMTSTKYIIESIGQQKFNTAINKTPLFLLDWKEKHEQIKMQVFWKCDNCKKDCSETIQAFRKFGKQFCCIKCLKQFKF